ncbi:MULTISPECIES: hypothetical protein [unclassified Streptomyces]|uniref:hypothetical protein n=1 Tax=unclassified Streptomyces TaxID=2593676 RepID=UPI000B80C6A9|nr:MULTISPECIES: hypothetical protein [unclassified Streptomyces]MYS23659.1 hypothetical protein [Streptomyces sp. SID4948]
MAALVAGSLLAVLTVLSGTAASAADMPVDPALPTPSAATGYGCGGADWVTPNRLPGFDVQLDVPLSKVNNVRYPGAVHAWDVDGSQSVEGVADLIPVFSQTVHVPLSLTDGHTYAWNASTYDGTAYSTPTATCYFTVDFSSPAPTVVTNPDFPLNGAPGSPLKTAGQPTTFHFSSRETLPAGCATAGTADCGVSGLDHFVYSLGGYEGDSGIRVPVDADGNASVTMSLSWGSQILDVSAVDAAGNLNNLATYTFYVPSPPPPPAVTTLSLTAPKSATRATPISVTGQLSAGPYPSGGVVHVTRTDLGHAGGTALPDVPVAADGTFGITDTPQIGGANTYRVSYPGDTARQAAGASVTTQLSRAATPLTLTGNASVYDYGGTATLTATLGPTYNGRTVSIWAQPYGGTKILVKTGTVDSAGRLSALYKLSGSTTFTASFAGDYRYAPATAVRTGYDRVALAETLGNSYASARIGTTLYRVYHHTATAVLKAAVTPRKTGQCAHFQEQQFSGGAWHTVVATGCSPLSSAGTAYGRLSLTHATGGKFRLRAEYAASAKDTTNVTTWGAWDYFVVKQ